MATQAATGAKQQQLASIHRFRIAPPRFTGSYTTFEEWTYKMTAYLGLQDPAYNTLLRQSENATNVLTDRALETAASTQAEGRQWLQLSTDLHFLLVNTCEGSVATIFRQTIRGNGFETWSLLHQRYALPAGTRSIGYLAKLLKPQLEDGRGQVRRTVHNMGISSWTIRTRHSEQQQHCQTM